MCRYKDICPAYNKRRERCTEKNRELDTYMCVPLLLEAYHSSKDTPYNDIKDYMSIIYPYIELPERNPIVTLIGSSTKFKDEFIKVEKELSLKGHIVLSCSFLNEPNESNKGFDQSLLTNVMHQKIRMSDKILVINPGGYIGKRTRSEILYAASINHPIFYFDDVGCEI